LNSLEDKISAQLSDRTENSEVHVGEPRSDATYAATLRSSSIIGGAQVINMAIGLVRTKAVAVLIGPTGVGLLGIFQTVIALASTMAGLGIQASGVRDVAKFHGANDRDGISLTIRTLRRVCWFTGIAGMLTMAALAPWISQVSFGSRNYTWSIVAVSLTIVLGNLSAGQGAVIQGTRRIGDLARMNVAGAFVGTCVSIGFYIWLGIDGIVPALVLLAVVSLAISTYYARKVSLTDVFPTWLESWGQAKSLIQFGLAIAYTGVITALLAYGIRTLIIREYDLAAAGIYTAAFSLSGMFVQFVLQAMGADYYPRLTAAASDHQRMAQLINEQTEIGLVLAFPGLLATLAFAPYLITLFYTSEFAPAAAMLQWFVVGCMIRVLQWPLGFSLLALGRGYTYATLQTVLHGMHIIYVWVFLGMFGIIGTSIAFAAMYVCGLGIVYFVTKRVIGFSWSKAVKQQLVWMFPLATMSFLLPQLLSQAVSTVLGGGVAIVSAVICLRQLVRRVGTEHRIVRTIKRFPGGSWLVHGL